MDDGKLAVENAHDAPLFSFEGYSGPAKCCKVYDGDSFHLIVMHEHKLVKLKCRLFGIDTPEMRGGCAQEKAAATVARDRVRKLILGKCVHAQLLGFDKYGRVLVNVTLPDMVDLSTLLISESLGYPYAGGTKRRWEPPEE